MELQMPATLKGLSDEKAARMMVALREGRKLRLFGVKAPQLEAYFRTHPGYAREALPLIEANAKAARLRKGAHLRDRTHCKHGHSLEGARVYKKEGYSFRFCVDCRKVDDAKGGILKPHIAEKIKTALRSPTATISRITKVGPSRLITPVALQAYRRADPEIEALARGVIATAISRGQIIRYALARTRLQTAARRDEANDYQKILALFPSSFPGRDDAAHDLILAVFEGKLQREEVRGRVKQFIAAHYRMFPTKFAKFGDRPLVSLDEAIFEDGATTRGDLVTHSLWD
jgi:hypothetical protein